MLDAKSGPLSLVRALRRAFARCAALHQPAPGRDRHVLRPVVKEGGIQCRTPQCAMMRNSGTVAVNGADSNKVVWRVQALWLQDDAEYWVGKSRILPAHPLTEACS